MSLRKKNTVQSNVPIIVYSHLRWEGVWQRPQQFLSRLSQQHRVLFVEGPFLVEGPCEPTFNYVRPTLIPT